MATDKKAQSEADKASEAARAPCTPAADETWRVSGERLDQLVQLLGECTRGPWRQCEPCSNNPRGCNLVWAEEARNDTNLVGGDECCMTNVDAKLIALSHEALPLLIREIREERKRRESPSRITDAEREHLASMQKLAADAAKENAEVCAKYGLETDNASHALPPPLVLTPWAQEWLARQGITGEAIVLDLAELLRSVHIRAHDIGWKSACRCFGYTEPAWKDGDDKPLPEDEEIDIAFPTRSGRHEFYAEAMRMVGAKYSKDALVALVNWLLVSRAQIVEELTKVPLAAPSSGAAGNTHPSQSSDAYGLPNDLRAAKEEISEWRSAIEALGVMGGPDALRRVAIEKSRHHDEHHEREARLLTLVQRAVTFVPFAQDTPHHFTEATIWLRDAAAALAADGSSASTATNEKGKVT